MSTIHTIQYLDPTGHLSTDYHGELSIDTLLRGYRCMWLARLIDERMITLQRQGVITFALSALGEEACSVASAAALEREDWIYPQYREAGVLFWRGFKAVQYIHHMFGDSEDLSLGRQMPNHFGSRELNVVTVSSPIGTKIPHAAGCAYAMKLKQARSVAVCFFGEGATSEGDFHVGVNFAAVRKAPVIFICRNNGYAISTPCNKQFACPGIAEKGFGYGIETAKVDGNDFFAMHEAVKNARKHCVEGHGPFLIEAMTYRMGAHSTSDDPSLYRQEQELGPWKEKCPILRLRKYLENAGAWNEQQEQHLINELTTEIQAAIDLAKNTPKPPLKLLVEHVYAKVPPALLKQYEEENA